MDYLSRHCSAMAGNLVALHAFRNVTQLVVAAALAEYAKAFLPLKLPHAWLSNPYKELRLCSLIKP